MTTTAPLHTQTPRRLGDDLGRFGTATALVEGAHALTYAELDERVSAFAARLGLTRRLVLLAAENTVDFVVANLGALRGRHAVMLAPKGDIAATRALCEFYAPDVIVDGSLIEERHATSGHTLHPELALLLSTSGSTGAPKLVRLSHDNLTSNADAVAESLGVTADDVAMTTLPPHYCYGLSVINSYLQRGATVVLSSLSVVDDCFWREARERGVTSFAGVPHTFELLERVGFEASWLPTLRYVTQAGGRMAADRVERFASLGFDLVVMYGQTEATARMAYLPPELASRYPGAIGRAIPGGALHLDDGELVYRGPNVMLGYATSPADLALGRVCDELRTGDIARVNDAGLFEIIGRRSRFIKPFGVRVDLDDLERVLSLEGVAAFCSGDDAHLVVGTTDAARAEAVVAHRLRLPRSHVSFVAFDVLPRLANGKPDYAALQTETVAPSSSIRDAFARVLGGAPSGDDTFVGLGGDSLSFVEMSILLEDNLGHLPRDWHRLTIAELEALVAPARRSRWASIDTSVVVRAIAIVLIVGSHTKLWWQQGGAHALLVVAGFNFARFQLTARSILPSVRRVVVPSVLYVGAIAAVSSKLGWSHALLVNNVLGADDSVWSYWFIEAIVQISLVLAAVFAVPALSRFERRHSMVVAYSAVAVGLIARFDLVPQPTSHASTWPQEVFWLFALGWAAARASSLPHRLVVATIAVTCVPGFFSSGSRAALVVGVVGVVAFLPTVRLPRGVIPIVTPIASASLFVYLTHIQVHPVLGRLGGPLAASVGSLVVGVLAWRVTELVQRRLAN